MIPAIEAYELAIRADPTNKSNFVTLARIQVWAGMYEDALENAEKALIGNDEYALAHAVKGWAQNFLGDHLEAKASIKKAIQLDPNSYLAHAYYAEILTDSGDYGDMEKAIDESRIAYDLSPTSLESLRARGYVLLNTGNYAESIEMYKSAVNINKTIPDLFLYLGYNYKNLGEYDLAIEYFVQANTLNPANDIPDLEASRVYATVGDFGKAVQFAELAVKDNPTYPYRYGNLGIMYYKAGDINKAIDTLSLAIRGGTNADGIGVEGLPLDYGTVASYYVYYGLALSQAVPNRCSEAVPVFQAVITGVPDDVDNVFNANYGLDLCSEAADEEPAGIQATDAP